MSIIAHLPLRPNTHSVFLSFVPYLNRKQEKAFTALVKALKDVYMKTEETAVLSRCSLVLHTLSTDHQLASQVRDIDECVVFNRCFHSLFS
jgi:hypothetical protein